MQIASCSGLELKRPGGETITKMLYFYMSLFVCTLTVVASNRFDTALRKHRANHYYVPQPMFLNELSHEPAAELTNNRTVYFSLNKILGQLKSQLVGSNNIFMPRMDDDRSTKKLKSSEILEKHQPKPVSERPQESQRNNAQQSTIDQANETTTINVPIQPLEPDDQYDHPSRESHTTAGTITMRRLASSMPLDQRARKMSELGRLATTSLPIYHSSRLIEATTRFPKRPQHATTRRSSLMEDEEEPMGDEDETEGGSLSSSPISSNEPGSNSNLDQNSLFKFTTQSSIKSAHPQKIKETKSRSPPVFIASSVGFTDSYQTSNPNSPPAGGIGSSLKDEHATLGPYQRRYGQKVHPLANGHLGSPARLNEYGVGPHLMDSIDNADEVGDLRSSTQLASINEPTYLDDLSNRAVGQWPNLSPQSIELTKVHQPSSMSALPDSQDRGYVRTRDGSRMSSPGPLATLYGTRDLVTGHTSYQQISQLQSQQPARQSTIRSPRDLLNQPQTIQITAVPNNGLTNGLTNQLIRINSPAPNGNLLTNGFNNLWNNGYLDPLGRQVMMVNAERRQIDWSFWIWPMIAVATLPLILGALFVPVFLKTIVVLIQILQSLGLLLPIAGALSQQISHASGATEVAAVASSASNVTTGNQQLEHILN